MLNLSFWKKKNKEEPQPQSEEDSPDLDEEDTSIMKMKKSSTMPDKAEGSSAEMLKIYTEIDKLKASVEGFGQVRSTFAERVSGINEQIGELRAMILDRDRTIQEIELKAVKAADLVETVQPEKLMIEVQKEDAKFEALKANLEGNESILEEVMRELKELRKKLDFFRGVEEIIKLSDEIKRDLVEIKKTEANVHVGAEKIEVIYTEFRKKYKDVDLFKDSLEEFKVDISEHEKEIEVISSKISNLADKTEIDKLTGRLDKYLESYKELNKNSSLTRDLAALKKLLGEPSKI